MLLPNVHSLVPSRVSGKVHKNLHFFPAREGSESKGLIFHFSRVYGVPFIRFTHDVGCSLGGLLYTR